MRKRKNYLNDPVVIAIDRASQAQYRLEDLVARVEEAILQEKERIRATYPLEGGVPIMSQKLLQYLQQEQNALQNWKHVALEEVIDVVNIKTLTKRIWPELQKSRSKKEGSVDKPTS